MLQKVLNSITCGLLVISLAGCTTMPADLVITGVGIYPAPGEPLQTERTLVVRDGWISSIRPTQAGDTSITTKRLLDGKGKTLLHGLWNSHVHFTDPTLAEAPQEIINKMLLRYGFTSVVDTGSILEQTLALRQQISAGRLLGPSIVLANGSFVPVNGTPSYLPGFRLPEVSNAAAAQPMVNGVLDAGADGIKMFSGSFQSPTETLYLPPDIVSAIAIAAKQRNSFSMAHPTTVQGLHNAVMGGVNVIAHTTPPEAEVPQEILQRMQAQGTALIPTLALWRYELEKFGAPEEQATFMENAAVAQLRQLYEANITILFGTDVGYKTSFDPTAEYRLMAKAGMDWPAIHRSLTTAPAKLFARFSGQLTPDVEGSVADADLSIASPASIRQGAPADLVLIDDDPAINIGALAQVAATIIRGKVVFEAQPGSD